MQKKHKIQKEVEEIKDVKCNKCGESLKPNTEHGLNDFYGLLGAKVSGGYYSTYLDDGKVYSFDLCEGCLVKLFANFKIAPTIEDYSI